MFISISENRIVYAAAYSEEKEKGVVVGRNSSLRLFFRWNEKLATEWGGQRVEAEVGKRGTRKDTPY